jgi:hydroxymethylpyrimidine pyrophosphatase-like HAD family hydrolase
MSEQSDDVEAVLARFLRESAFVRDGAVLTDLDGTAVHEAEGRGFISAEVEAGLAEVHAAGRQVIVNTMRFPLSVIRVFGAEWFRITGHPIPLVSLNGSQVGVLRPQADGVLGFDELESFPLDDSEVREVMTGVRGIVEGGGDDLLVFWYPRDWRQGECIWTPRAERVRDVAVKYRSASHVQSGSVDALQARLLAQPLCMLFLLIDAPEDRLMAYQHTERTRFVTRNGVDKRSGAQAIARHLGVSLPDSIGAGDAPADTFLDSVGLAVIVGPGALGFRGRRHTLRVAAPAHFGRLLRAGAAALGR